MEEYRIELDSSKILVREKNSEYTIDLQERLLNFAADTLKFLSQLPYQKEFEVFRYQLSKSVTSIGANYEESQAGTFPEFRNRISICLREARETCYWYKLIKRVFGRESDLAKDIQPLLQEAKEISLIFGSISRKIKK